MDKRALTLRGMRTKAGLSQWQVARALGRTQGWLSNIEMGYVPLPEFEVEKIAAAITKLEKAVKRN